RRFPPAPSAPAGAHAAAPAPHRSQNLLPGPSSAPQPAHAPPCRSRRPQVEQNTASGSGRGPQAGQVAAPGGAELTAERSARTLAATMVSTSPAPRPATLASAAASSRSASSAASVYLPLRNA